MFYLPSKYDEEVETIPCVCKVSFLSKEAHCHDLDCHLNCKKGKDAMIKYLEYSTTNGCTRNVIARLIHSKCDTVEQNNCHANPFKPRMEQTVKESHTRKYVFT